MSVPPTHTSAPVSITAGNDLPKSWTLQYGRGRPKRNGSGFNVGTVSCWFTYPFPTGETAFDRSSPTLAFPAQGPLRPQFLVDQPNAEQFPHRNGSSKRGVVSLVGFR